MKATLAIALAAVLTMPGVATAAGKRAVVTIAEQEIQYLATPGIIPLLNDSGTERGQVFYTSYLRLAVGREAASARPVVFLFNGGPGSSSAWLHLGAFGPQRLVLGEGGLQKPQKPYRTTANEHSLVDVADLVFVDPIGTGFSRAADVVAARGFYSFRGDVRSMAEFIKLYLDENGRRASPCFVIGESYGALRACGLVPELEENHGIVANGIVLVSGPIVIGRRSTPDQLLPTAAATAHFHGLLDDSLQALDRKALLARVERFIEEEYRVALAAGDDLDESTRARVAGQVEQFTGLRRPRSIGFNLREVRALVSRELPAESVGVYDTRVTSNERGGRFRGGGRDPAMTVIGQPMEEVMQDYLTGSLGYETDLDYRLLHRIGIWSHSGSRPSDRLGRALKTNRGLRVMVASGLYDTVTPLATVRQAVEDADMTPAQRKAIRYHNYEGGHMMYTNLPELERLSADVREFIRDAAKRKRGPALIPVVSETPLTLKQ